MTERLIVDAIVDYLKGLGFKVATEVPNFYRSADVAAIDPNGEIWIIECKLSNVKQALTQSKVHLLSADKVFIGMPFREPKQETMDKIRRSGVGLLYVMPDGSIDIAIDDTKIKHTWFPARNKLIQRIAEVV
ncbi:MAG: hypothetical protein ACHQQQ_12485 [Bacteroidota bacterium]